MNLNPIPDRIRTYIQPREKVILIMLDCHGVKPNEPHPYMRRLFLDMINTLPSKNRIRTLESKKRDLESRRAASQNEKEQEKLDQDIELNKSALEREHQRLLTLHEEEFGNVVWIQTSIVTNKPGFPHHFTPEAKSDLERDEFEKSEFFLDPLNPEQCEQALLVLQVAYGWEDYSNFIVTSCIEGDVSGRFANFEKLGVETFRVQKDLY